MLRCVKVRAQTIPSESPSIRIEQDRFRILPVAKNESHPVELTPRVNRTLRRLTEWTRARENEPRPHVRRWVHSGEQTRVSSRKHRQPAWRSKQTAMPFTMLLGSPPCPRGSMGAVDRVGVERLAASMREVRVALCLA